VDRKQAENVLDGCVCFVGKQDFEGLSMIWEFQKYLDFVKLTGNVKKSTAFNIGLVQLGMRKREEEYQRWHLV
jgi:hypothetical protein